MGGIKLQAGAGRIEERETISVQLPEHMVMVSLPAAPSCHDGRKTLNARTKTILPITTKVVNFKGKQHVGRDTAISDFVG